MKSDDILFHRENGLPFKLSTTYPNKLLNTACKKVGINKHITNHSFRHGFITRVYKKSGIVTA
jgi:integrase